MRSFFQRPQLMGILNITPDSFSDGSTYAVPDAALARFVQLVEEGADIIDIGAESTRPHATPLTWQEEWTRLQPILERISNHSARKNIRLSVDTRHAKTVAQLSAYAVDIVNDQGGLNDGAMCRAFASSKVQIIAMHALSIPVDPAVTLPEDADPIIAIKIWKNEVLEKAKKAGIAHDRLIFDPGIGFGKTAAQSYQLIARANELTNSQDKWLYGHSKKSFLSLFTHGDAKSEARAALTLAFSAQLAALGVSVLRVHDVAAHRAMLATLGEI